jgi:hypothetical protein
VLDSASAAINSKIQSIQTEALRICCVKEHFSDLLQFGQYYRDNLSLFNIAALLTGEIAFFVPQWNNLTLSQAHRLHSFASFIETYDDFVRVYNDRRFVVRFHKISVKRQ